MFDFFMVLYFLFFFAWFSNSLFLFFFFLIIVSIIFFLLSFLRCFLFVLRFFIKPSINFFIKPFIHCLYTIYTLCCFPFIIVEESEAVDEMKKLEEQIVAATEQAKREAVKPKEKVLFVRLVTFSSLLFHIHDSCIPL